MSLHPEMRARRQSADLVGLRAGYLDDHDDLMEAGVFITRQQLARSAFLVGATGSGKTVTLTNLMAKDILHRHSFAVLDLRGDQTATVLELLPGNVDPRLVVDLDLSAVACPTVGFNPLVGAGEAARRALCILDLLEASSSSWGPQLSEHLRNAWLILAECGGALTQTEALFHDAGFRRWLIARTGEARLREFWTRYDRLSAERQGAIAGPCLNKVSLLFCTKALVAHYGQANPIDLGRRLNTPGTVLLANLACHELNSAGVLAGAILLSAICREAFSRVEIPESRRVPVRLYVDEFADFGWGNFEQVLAAGRKWGLSLVCALQSLSQLTPKMRSMLLGNVSTLIAFRTNREDGAVLSKHMTGDPKALDIAGLPVGFAYVWHPGEVPVLTELNGPLVTDVGRVSPAARAYRRHLREIAPEYAPLPLWQESPQPASSPLPRASKDTLEDWLR